MDCRLFGFSSDGLESFVLVEVAMFCKIVIILYTP